MQEGLEPTETGHVPADPEEFDTAEGTESTTFLSVPNVLEDTGKGCHTDTGTDEHGHFRAEDVFGGGTIGAIDADYGQGTGRSRGINLDKVTASTHTIDRGLFVLFDTLERGLGEAGDNARSSTDTFTECFGEIANLTNVHGHVGVLGGGSDGERVPFESGDFGDLDEEPLAGGILEAWLDHAEFHRARGVHEDLVELCGTASTDLAPDAFTEIEDTGPDDSAPGEVAEADVGVVKGKGVREAGQGGSAHEAAGGVGVETDHEEEGEMMGIPKRFKALLADFVVGGTVHDYHDEEHDMAGDATGLLVVNVEGVSRTELATFDVDKVDIVRGGVDHGPESHRVRDLTMEPNVLVCREKPCHVWANDTDNVAEHRDEDEEAIDGEYETGTTRSPDG